MTLSVVKDWVCTSVGCILGLLVVISRYQLSDFNISAQKGCLRTKQILISKELLKHVTEVRNQNSRKLKSTATFNCEILVRTSVGTLTHVYGTWRQAQMLTLCLCD